MFIASIAAAAVLAQTAPAVAATTQPAAPASSAATAAAQPAAAPAHVVKTSGSDVVCHKEYQVGSNIPTKVCRSRTEEEANRQESRQTLEHMQTNLGMRQ